MTTLGIHVNRKSAVPLQKQFESALRSAILSGGLRSGERLLSSREFQTHLGLSRNTILNALDQLHAEGYLVTRQSVGTFVAPHVHPLWMNTSDDEMHDVVPSKRAAKYLGAAPGVVNFHRTVAFRPGMPALDLFPAARLRRAFKASAWTPPLLDYGSPFGHMPLRAALSKRLRQTRGIVCGPDDVLITNGAQSAFALIARVLIDHGDVAIVEDPGYASLRAAFLTEGARISGAPVDESGIVVATFQKRRAKVVCVTPSHQYPSGAILSLERRFALLDWAAKHDSWIVEDDYDAEFNYTNRPQPALQGLGGGRRVIYVGTFSKVLSPALRVAYLVVPAALRTAFEATHSVTGGAPSAILQSALAEFIDSGSLGRHVARMRAVYDERRRFVRDELVKRAASIFDIQDSRAGLHFVASLPKNVPDVRFSQRAAERGIILPPLSSYYFAAPPRNGVVIGFAATSVPKARAAIQTLVEGL